MPSRNSRNAQHSTGPRSREGLARSSQNATRHGLRSAAIVVPALGETEQAWQAHLASCVADLAPVGAIESHLAERIALLLWRYRRAGRAEAGLIRARAHHYRELDFSFYALPATLQHTLRQMLEAGDDGGHAWEWLQNAEDDDPVPPHFFARLSLDVMRQSRQSIPETTAGAIRAAIGEQWETMAGNGTVTYRVRQAEHQHHIEEAQAHRAHEREASAIPRIESLARWEAHCSRELSATLATLHRCQERRLASLDAQGEALTE